LIFFFNFVNGIINTYQYNINSNTLQNLEPTTKYVC